MIMMNVEEGRLPDAINIMVTKYSINQFCVAWSEEEQCWKVSFPDEGKCYEQDD